MKRHQQIRSLLKLLPLFLIFIYTNCSAQNQTIQNPGTHYNILPSAFGLEEDQMQLMNFDILMNGLEYGITDHISIRAIFELFNPIFASEAPSLSIQPKFSIDLSDDIHVAANLIYAHTFGDGSITIPHVMTTIGNREKNISLGGGYVIDRLFGARAEYFGLSVGGILPINQKWSLVSDNWFLFDDEILIGNPFNFISLSARTTIKNKYHLDVGLFANTDQDDFGNYPWPIVKFYGDINRIFQQENKTNKLVKEERRILRQQRSNDRTIDKGHRVIYGEIGGVGGIYSINYDRRFKDTASNNGLGFRAGFSAIFGIFAVPVQLNYLIGRRHYLELGLGATIASDMYDQSFGRFGGTNASGTASIKYRFQALDQGLFFNIGGDIFFAGGLLNDTSVVWAGAGIGYTF